MFRANLESPIGLPFKNPLLRTSAYIVLQCNPRPMCARSRNCDTFVAGSSMLRDKFVGTIGLPL